MLCRTIVGLDVRRMFRLAESAEKILRFLTNQKSTFSLISTFLVIAAVGRLYARRT